MRSRWYLTVHNMPLLLLLFLLPSAVDSEAGNKSPHHLVRFEPGYNVHQAPTNPPAPNGTHTPLQVNFSINLRNVLGVSEKEQLLSLECTIRMFWRDRRVSLAPGAVGDSSDSKAYVTLNPSVAHRFWTPDVFVDRAKDLRVPTYLTRPASLRVYADSTLRYSSRVNFDVACPMEFRRFPVDEQLCEVNLESFGHSSKQLTFRWLPENQVNPNITLSQFTMDVTLSDSYSTEFYDLAYPGVIMRIRLRRQIGYHIVQTYVPSIVFVVLAWLSLFISHESVPGRVGMGMTTLLTLTAMFGAVRQEVPRVSYVSFLDIWMVACILFVFACILEFTVVCALIRAGKAPSIKKVEFWSRVVVPIAFALFNLIYWPSLYLGGDEEDSLMENSL